MMCATLCRRLRAESGFWKMKLERVAQGREQEGAHRGTELVGRAEMSPGNARHPSPVLAEQWPVDAEALVEHLHYVPEGERAQDRTARVTEQHLTGEKDKYAQDDERQDRQP